MTQLDVLDFKTGNIVSKMDVPDYIIQAAERPGVLDFISNYLYRTKKVSFVKTASTKGISEISGTTKKPYKQKGTGNARQGSLRSPQFRGGANIFGPLPITANYKINKKEVKLAKAIFLGQLIKSSLVKVVNSLNGASKTKDFLAAKEIIVPNVNKVIFISNTGVSNLDTYLAGRNVNGVSFDAGLHFNVYRVSNHEMVVITQEALNELFQNLL